MQDSSIPGIRSIARAAAWRALMLLAALLLSSPFATPVDAQTNMPPQFPNAHVQREVAENTPPNTNIGAPIAATDQDTGDTLTYSLTGPDADHFQVVPSTGQLRTKSPLNFELLENPAFAFTLEVHDGKDENGQPDTTIDAAIGIRVDITNLNEAGSLTILSTQPHVYSVVRARLTDLDGGIRREEWEWSRSRDRSTWSRIETGNRDAYIPQAGDAGMYLRVEVTYLDGASPSLMEVRTLQSVSVRVGAEKPPRPVKVTELVTGLTIPWDLAFTPDGTMLFTQRGGQISARLTDGTVQLLSVNMMDLSLGQESGLMSIVVDPNFSSNRRFYTCQAHSDTPGDKTDEDDEVQVIAWTVNAGYTAATRANDPLVGGMPSNSRHSGCRLRFGPSGYLWITTGDAQVSENSQDLTSLGGKVLRVVASTGAGAPGNPFSSSSTPPGSPLVYTYGHRNVQGLARRPGTSQMWAVEHGPQIDDEINLLVRGKNYGWDPGPDYTADELITPMTDRGKFPNAVEAKWSSGDPTIAPSGGVFLEGSGWGPWRGMLAVASLRERTLRVFDFDSSGRLRSEFSVPELDHAYGLNRYGRLRSPVMGPDGSLYVTTSQGGGRDAILKVTPVAAPRFPYLRPLHRTVRTGAPAGTNAGAAITARKAGGGRLTYSLSDGPDDAYFDIDPSSGQLRTSEDFVTDTEGLQYEVEVSVHDGVPDDNIDDRVRVIINVAGTAPPPGPPPGPPPPPTNNGGGGGGGFAPVASPEFAEGVRGARTVPANAGPGDAVGEPVTATDPGGTAVTYSVRGPGAEVFAVDPDTGQLTVREGAALAEGEAHTVTIAAQAASGALAFIDIVVTVTAQAHHAYDANKNGSIDRGEVLEAVKDYFDGEIEKDDVIAIIKLYFDDS